MNRIQSIKRFLDDYESLEPNLKYLVSWSYDYYQKELQKEYGSDGLSKKFLTKLKLAGFISQALKIFESWDDFRQSAGFEVSNPIASNRISTLCFLSISRGLV